MAMRWVARAFWQFLSVRNVLVMLFAYVIWKGERRVFSDAAESCNWNAWERWPSEARPHRIVLVADPQIVDAHSYPRAYSFLQRPLEFFTDLYLYRTYTAIQRALRPGTTIFLGDLFDGGREWSTRDFHNKDSKRYKGDGDEYFAEEYARLSRIYFKSWKMIDHEIAAERRKKWQQQRRPRRQQEGQEEEEGEASLRRLICSLPGNHDLGFANGVHRSTRQRFGKWFGPVDRVDVVGNHTFVSVDTPSLSAIDQYIDKFVAQRGSPNIWKETANFLDNLDTHKQDAIAHELALLRAKEKLQAYKHKKVDDGKDQAEIDRPRPDFLPTILLTHIPLWREPNTPCGPLREKYRTNAASRASPAYEGDAIRIMRGWQYQTVLTDRVTNMVMQAAGPGVEQVYSGDDHDYCEVTHDRFENAPREVTVKSTSFVMGVRRPAVMLVSLWNPLDLDNYTVITTPNGQSSSHHKQETTLQDQLCVLPDQLGTWMMYVRMALFTAIVLSIQAILTLRYGSTSRAPDALFAPQLRRKSATGAESLLPLKLPHVHNPDPLLAPRPRRLSLSLASYWRLWHSLVAAPFGQILSTALLWYLVLLVTWSF